MCAPEAPRGTEGPEGPASAAEDRGLVCVGWKELDAPCAPLSEASGTGRPDGEKGRCFLLCFCFADSELVA